MKIEFTDNSYIEEIKKEYDGNLTDLTDEELIELANNNMKRLW